ncbi:MAG: cysteine desulfurase [Afipia sp.]|nr:cysteine desulfurase [Afipia sp.]
MPDILVNSERFAGVSRGRIYLDWNATALLRPEARVATASALETVGNPSSVHEEGRAARSVVECARSIVAKAVGAQARNVIFTSGGTEANALALSPGLHRQGGAPVERLIVSTIEHPSVLAGGRFSSDVITQAPVTREGVVDLDALRLALNSNGPALVSIMLANNETGAIQPIAEVAALIHAAGSVLHVDAIQAFGKIPVDLNALGADCITLSAHKLGGPKGVGALLLADGVQGLSSLVRGGGQEQGRRAGTENVAGIVGFGAATDAAMRAMTEDSERMLRLRSRLEAGLKATPGVVIFGESVPRIPNTTLFAAPGMKAETAVIAFDLEGIALSSGSACSSGKVQPSHVLAAMNVPHNVAAGALRLSTGWQTSEAEIDRTLEAWRKLSGVLVRG